MKNLFLLSTILLAGCGPRFVGNPPESLTEKVSLIERQMSEQEGKIEVLEHQNKKLKQDMDLLKKMFTTTPTDMDMTPSPVSKPNGTQIESDEPTDLDTLPPMPPSPITED